MLEQTEIPHEISEAENTKSAGLEKLETLKSIETLEAKVKAFAFERESDARAISPDSQKRIAEWQEKKHAAMSTLQKWFEAIERGEAIQNGTHARTVHQNPEGVLYLIEKNGSEKKEIPLTRGELLTDILWESEYRLEKDVLPELRKEFALAVAEKEISSLLDRQIALWESEQNYNVGGGEDKAYRKILETLETGNLTPGLIAEKMVESFLMKLAIDHNLPYTIEIANTKLDVESKIDFIVHATHSLGARMKESSREDIGIQFSTTERREKIEQKESQVRNTNSLLSLSSQKEKVIKELIFISLPLSDSKTLYERWKSENPPAPGGPDKLWDVKTQKLILEGILGEVFSQAELGNIEDKVFREKPLALAA